MSKFLKPFLILLLATFSCLQSCKDKVQKTSKTEINHKANPVRKNKIPDFFKSDLRPDKIPELGKIYTDTVQYVNFSDEGDDYLFIVKKNTDTIALIYNKDEVDFVRGNIIEIKWKMDSMRYAGDPEFLNFTEILVSAKTLKTLQLVDKKIKFLWRETKYNKNLKTDINSIVLNENYIKTISDPEKAALAYVATFVGNECEWDGDAKEDRSNLDCKILSALNLGYQCSYQHLSFLRTWFRSNKDIIKDLENCPTTPDGATIQDTFDEINLEVKNNQIIVFFKANGINLREGKSWTWTEKHILAFKKNELILLKKEISPVIRDTFDVRGN